MNTSRDQEHKFRGEFDRIEGDVIVLHDYSGFDPKTLKIIEIRTRSKVERYHLRKTRNGNYLLNR